jgi:hypothetical protein
MDFFAYLKNSGKEKIVKVKKEKKDESSINDKLSEKEDTNKLQEKHVYNHNFKRGETVMIVRHENSIFNIYKGYYAEIKEYRQNSEHAYVILPALNYPKLMKIPIVHFQKL